MIQIGIPKGAYPILLNPNKSMYCDLVFVPRSEEDPQP